MFGHGLGPVQQLAENGQIHLDRFTSRIESHTGQNVPRFTALDNPATPWPCIRPGNTVYIFVLALWPSFVASIMITWIRFPPKPFYPFAIEKHSAVRLAIGHT